MKTQVLLFFCLIPFLAISQEVGGKILYTETVNLEKIMAARQSDRPMPPGFEFPKERSHAMVLLVDGTESLYVNNKEAEEEEIAEQGGRSSMFRMMREERRVYQNTADSTFIEETDFMQKKFLINGPPDAYQWKMTSEQMQVGSYLCLKAVAGDTSETIEAWFTPQIPVHVGPAHYGGLPGLVLHVNINDGERTITATEINLEGIEADAIIKPEKGKEVTREEFREIVAEKRAEMREMHQGEGGRHIFIRQD